MFIETITIPWEQTLTINIHNGYYIKDIRMVQQSGVLSYITIELENTPTQDLFVPAMPVYKKLFGFSSINSLPFYANKVGISNFVKISTDVPVKEGFIRYDVYRGTLSESNIEPLLTTMKNKTLSAGYVNTVVRQTFKETPYSKTIDILGITLDETYIMRKDPINIFRVYSLMVPTYVENYSKSDDLILFYTQ